MTTNLWTVGQGLITRRLVPKTASGALARRGRSARSRTPAARGRERRGRAPSAEAEAAAAARAAAAREAQEGRLAPVTTTPTRRVTVEATGETVGEAKWKALRELERLAPGLDKAAVRFQVVSEGERGLLGVGYTPARVRRARPMRRPLPADASRAATSPRRHITCVSSSRR